MCSIAKRIKVERERKRWTQQELAEKAGIRQSFIGALESNNQKGSSWLPEIAHALGVDAYWLKTGRGRKNTDDPIEHFPDDLRAQVQWLIENADDEIRTMFAFMVQAMYLKKHSSNHLAENKKRAK